MYSPSKVIISLFACFVFFTFGAHATAIDVDFSSLMKQILSSGIINLVQPQYMPIVAQFWPPLGDTNGSSTMTIGLDGMPVIHIGGNGMRDCDSELGVLREVLKNETLTLPGGMSHQMALDAWNHNAAKLQECIGVYWTVFSSLAPGLQEILTGYTTIGNGSFSASGSNYSFSGSGGLVSGFLTLWSLYEGVAKPELTNVFSLDGTGKPNYTRLAWYLGPMGDANGDKKTNSVDYNTYGTVPLPNPLPNPLPAILQSAIATAASNYVAHALAETASLNVDHNQWYVVGEPLDLTAETNNITGKLNYLWFKDGEPMPSDTTKNYYLKTVGFSDSGSYTCQITDASKRIFMAGPLRIKVFPVGSLPAPGAPGMMAAMLAAFFVIRRRVLRGR